jgi:hypothetical protein
VTRSSSRGAFSAVLIVLAAAAALAGALALYLRTEILDSGAFADRAVAAIQQPTVQRVMAREIAVQVIEPGVPDLVAARPVIESAVRLVVSSTPFAPVIRLAAEQGHRLLFERGGGNAVFDLADAGTIVSAALRTLAPKVAREIPAKTEAVLLTLRRRSFAGDTLRFAETARAAGIVLPALAVLLFALAIVVARDRRRAITRSAAALAVVGVALVIALAITRRYLVSHTYGSNELTNADVRGAVGELWDSYLGDLQTWALTLSVLALLVALASATVLATYSPTSALQRLLGATRRPASAPQRVARGVAALAIGTFVVVEPARALRGLAVLCGCVVVYFGAGELLRFVPPAEAVIRGPQQRARRRAAAAAALAAAIAAAIVGAFAFSGATQKVQANAPPSCNGYAQLCGRRLDEVVFAGTHNSMSAADSPSWLIANQDRAITRQLEDGIRLFKISTHYGVQSPAGWVSTDIAAEGTRLNRVAAKLPPIAREALQRLSRSVGRGSVVRGKRDIWLCHTLCELGATRMVDFLGAIRQFLERNPDQVMILFDEDYVAERDLQAAFIRAGLFSRLATLQPGQPLPTLGDLIRSRHNLVVFAQKHTSGKYAWDPYAFNWIQDTPLGATKPRQFTCKRNRGSATNPLLMMNDWADVFPPRPSPNVPLVKRPFILARARQCIRQRGLMPNLVLTDFYNRGDVIRTVAELNGLAPAAPSPPR